MRFSSLKPSDPLRPFIQCYMVADARATTERGEYTMFPNGYSGVFFNFGNTGSLIIKEEYKTPAVSVFGQIDRHFTAVHWPGFYSIGVIVRPTVLSSLLNINMSELTNRAVDGLLIDKRFSDLHEQLTSVVGTREQIDLIERFFIRLLKHNESGLIGNALHLLELRPDLGIEQVASKLGVSQRYLEVRFKHDVGLSPKTYSLIMRFKAIEEQMRNMSSIRWRNMSFAHLYHDQNHFIKDFKRFTGHTPSGYLMNSFDVGRSYLSARSTAWRD